MIKYRNMVKALLDEINDGGYSESDPFPSERVLMKRYRAARETVRRALGVLHAKGLLQRCPGRAATVTGKVRGSRRRIGIMISGYNETEIFCAVRDEVVRLAGEMMIDVLSVPYVATLGTGADAAVSSARWLIERGIDGVILQPVQHSTMSDEENVKIAKMFTGAGIAVVLIDCDIVRKPRRSEYDLVTIDNFDAGRIAAEHVVSGGARKITFISRENCANTVRDRMDGVYTVADQVAVEWMKVESMSDHVQLMNALCSIEDMDALICQNDGAARNVATVLKKMGKRIPTDVMVVGFDDVRAARNATPGLTSVRQPCREIARHAFRLVLERLECPSQPTIHIQCRETLVVRSSTERSWR